MVVRSLFDGDLEHRDRLRKAFNILHQFFIDVVRALRERAFEE